MRPTVSRPMAGLFPDAMTTMRAADSLSATRLRPGTSLCSRVGTPKGRRQRVILCCHNHANPPPSRRDTLLAGVLAPCSCAVCRPRSRWYDDIFASLYSHSMDSYEETLAPRKQKLFANLQGAKDGATVLEVGVGPGPNLKYYSSKDHKAKVTGLDPNNGMGPYARATAESLGLSDFQFVDGYAEEMPFEDGAFDAAVGTLVMCSVEDPEAALSEVRRVLRPGGRYYFLEHVVGPPGSLLRAGQYVLSPLQQALADGCHLTRDTLASIRAAGFKDVDAERFDVEGLSLLAPHIAGVATV